MNPKDIYIVQCERLSKLDWLVHGSTTRQFNPIPGNKEEELVKLANFWNIEPYALLYAHQRHTNHAIFLDEKQFENMNRSLAPYDKTDGVGTEVKGILAAIFTADCIPIFMVDVKKRRFMLVHAGWRGTLQRFAANAVDNLIQRGSDPKDMIVWMGPAICGRCYEVSEDMAGQFAAQFPAAPHAIKGRFLDLKEINAFQIREKGVPDGSIEISEYCTRRQSELFYSYRALGALRGSIVNAAMIL
ncbi:peptidoglycan editing factor PgeF [Candidatus Sumerlaeota bacterium]|nr:peptidoglycan editing factor PgeF [Candidatus Sumerlaeota bacterium]